MLALNIILYALLGTSLVFAIVELGLSAFVVSAFDTTQEVETWGGLVDVHVKAPAIVDFMLFASLWTILIAVAAVLLPWFYTRKGSVTPKLNTILAASFVAVYSVTMVFWLAAFADLATYVNVIADSYFDALIAFAVLLWLIFVALIVFTVLAMCGVMVSDWAGYQSLRKDKAHVSTAGPVHDHPMSMNPVTPMAPSELSSRDAEDLHNQPNNQSFSPSLPSAVHSVELDAENVSEHRAGTHEVSPA